jgi:pyruvate,water dikinase
MKEIKDEKWRIGCHANEPVQGRVVIIESEMDLHKVQEGDVMIANQTDVNYTPQMLESVAIVTVEGGRYSHAATFSRENQIPCITGAVGIMDRLSDGDIIIVDTHSKTITVI